MCSLCLESHLQTTSWQDCQPEGPRTDNLNIEHRTCLNQLRAFMNCHFTRIEPSETQRNTLRFLFAWARVPFYLEIYEDRFTFLLSNLGYKFGPMPRVRLPCHDFCRVCHLRHVAEPEACFLPVQALHHIWGQCSCMCLPDLNPIITVITV